MKQKIETIEEVQKIELGILEYLDRVCRDNNLRYYLAYGTLLGAVRHQGFIPWDDDIDVWMPRGIMINFRNYLRTRIMADIN